MNMASNGCRIENMGVGEPKKVREGALGRLGRRLFQAEEKLGMLVD
jgi:hypothetical protein